MFRERLPLIPPGTPLEGVTDEGQRKWMESSGLFPAIPVQGPSETGEPLSPVRVWKGTPEQQEIDRKQGILNEAADSVGSAEVPPGEALRYQMAAALLRTGANPGGLIEPQYPTEIWDEASQKMVGTTAPGSRVAILNRPYTGGAAAFGPQFVRVIDPATRRPITSGRLTFDQIQAYQQQGMHVEPTYAGTSDLGNGQVAATLRNRVTDMKGYLAAREEVEREKYFIKRNYVPGTSDESPETLGARAELRSSLAQLAEAEKQAGNVQGSHATYSE